MHLHLNNDRQGPGSEEMTRLALDIYRMADLGCGTGAQTLTLAQELQGEIVAVDLFETFLEKMQERIHNAHLKASVTSLATSIDHLPFAEGEFDIIWSEGAVYNIGFRKGTGYWKNFLKEGGILAVSELSWTTGSRPNELEQFWPLHSARILLDGELLPSIAGKASLFYEGVRASGSSTKHCIDGQTRS